MYTYLQGTIGLLFVWQGRHEGVKVRAICSTHVAIVVRVWWGGA